MKKIIYTIIIILLSCTILNCNKKESDTDTKDQILILYPNWIEGIAVTNLAEVVLEKKGYDVKIKPIEPGLIYASLAKGDADLFLDAWLPHTHKEYWKKYGKKIDKLGETFSNGTTGLVVPEYCPEESISDLKKSKGKYDRKIIGIGSGAGIHQNTKNAIAAYNLPFEQITSSGPAMLASLEKAYKKEECIVITGWKPHFMWSKFGLKYLKDPKEIYPKDVMAILARKGFKKDYPEVTKFLKKFNFEEEELYRLIKEIKEGSDPLMSAKKWCSESDKKWNK